MFRAVIDIASNAMSAQRLRVKTIASNIANAETTRTAEGGPYKRKDVALQAIDVPKEDSFSSMLDEASLKGVRASEIVEDKKEPRLVYDPSHPDANPQTGYVEFPNINPVTEMVNMINASNSYKAAAEIVNITKSMAQSVRQLGRRF